MEKHIQILLAFLIIIALVQCEKIKPKYNPKDRLNLCMYLLPSIYEANKNETERMLIKVRELEQINETSNETYPEEANDNLISLFLVNCYDYATDDELDSIYEAYDLKREFNVSKYDRIIKYQEISDMLFKNQTDKLNMYIVRIERMNNEVEAAEPPKANFGVFGVNLKEISKNKANFMGFGLLFVVIFILAFLSYLLLKKDSNKKKKKKDKKKSN